MHGRASPSTPSTTAVLVVRKPQPPPSLLNRFASALFHTVAYSIAWSVCLLFERRPGASSATVMADEPVPAPKRRVDTQPMSVETVRMSQAVPSGREGMRPSPTEKFRSVGQV